MTFLVRLFGAVLLALLACSAVVAETRVALVIGNAAYERGALLNPVNDANDVTAMLEGLGFTVTKALDLDDDAFVETLSSFGATIKDADVAIFYYAGHGLQFGGENYLVPVDARLSDELSVKHQTASLSDVIELMDGAKISLVFIDACRNNPLAEDLARSLQAEGRSAPVGRGLASPAVAARDVLVAFAAAPGEVAEDGVGQRNSPFTTAVLNHLPTPDIEISTALKRVTSDVRVATNNKQGPQQVSDMATEFYMARGIDIDPVDPEQQAFDRAKAANTVAAWTAFLEQYGEGRFRTAALEGKEAAEEREKKPVVVPLRSSTLEAVRDKAYVTCGVSEGDFGFSVPDSNNQWMGLDVDYCRALASAILNDPQAVRYVPLPRHERFSALASGDVDVLARTRAPSPGLQMGIRLVGTTFHDGQGFMVNRYLDVTSLAGISGAVVCVLAGTAAEATAEAYFERNSLEYNPISFVSQDEVFLAYESGRCDAVTAEISLLAASRAQFADPSSHVILPELISNDPTGPAVRDGDEAWFDVAHWVYQALIAAEELGVGQSNLEEMLGSDAPQVRRLLGIESDFGTQLGLTSDWAYNVIRDVGNYGESYERNIGLGTPIGLGRGANALHRDGGLQTPLQFPG